MKYEDAHRRYGTHVSQRLRRELAPSEFNQIAVDNLHKWLVERAEAAHDQYCALLNNPLSLSEDSARTGEACKRWRGAEDLAYLIAVAEDVGSSLKVG